MRRPTFKQVEDADHNTKTAAYDLATTAVLYVEKLKSKRDLVTKVKTYRQRLNEFLELYEARNGTS